MATESVFDDLDTRGDDLSTGTPHALRRRQYVIIQKERIQPNPSWIVRDNATKHQIEMFCSYSEAVAYCKDKNFLINKVVGLT
jgi:hypothetical protein